MWRGYENPNCESWVEWECSPSLSWTGSDWRNPSDWWKGAFLISVVLTDWSSNDFCSGLWLLLLFCCPECFSPTSSDNKFYSTPIFMAGRSFLWIYLCWLHREPNRRKKSKVNGKRKKRKERGKHDGIICSKKLGLRISQLVNYPLHPPLYFSTNHWTSFNYNRCPSCPCLFRVALLSLGLSFLIMISYGLVDH